jgi:thioredoxin-related protein
MAQILAGFKKRYGQRVDVEEINVARDEATAEKYRIESVPALIFLSPEGKVLFQTEGVMSEEELLAKWSELGYDL